MKKIEFVEDVRYPLIRLSAREEKGIDLLRDHLKETMGFNSNTEGGFWLVAVIYKPLMQRQCT